MLAEKNRSSCDHQLNTLHKLLCVKHNYVKKDLFFL